MSWSMRLGIMIIFTVARIFILGSSYESIDWLYNTYTWVSLSKVLLQLNCDVLVDSEWIYSYLANWLKA